MSYEDWQRQVPAAITGDVLWKVEAYRLALFAGDLAWTDSTRLISDKRTISLADQLYRATGSISSDIAEGYSRSSPRDRARFYEYALGSARESRDWYYKGRYVLTEDTTEQRMDVLTRIIRLLLTMISQEHRNPNDSLRNPC